MNPRDRGSGAGTASAGSSPSTSTSFLPQQVVGPSSRRGPGRPAARPPAPAGPRLVGLGESPRSGEMPRSGKRWASRTAHRIVEPRGRGHSWSSVLAVLRRPRPCGHRSRRPRPVPPRPAAPEGAVAVLEPPAGNSSARYCSDWKARAAPRGRRSAGIPGTLSGGQGLEHVPAGDHGRLDLGDPLQHLVGGQRLTAIEGRQWRHASRAG